jgi:hypothetical protein
MEVKMSENEKTATAAVKVTTDGRIFVHGLEIKQEAIVALQYILTGEKPREYYEAIAETIATITLHHAELAVQDPESADDVLMPPSFLFLCKRLMEVFKIYDQKGGQA